MRQHLHHAPPQAAYPARAAVGPSLPLLLGLALVLSPIAMAQVGLGGPARLAFAGGATALAAWLAVSRPAAFVGLCLWLLLLSPFLRRFVDFHAGWAFVNPLMLAPYVAMLCAAPTAVSYLLRRGPRSQAIAVMLVAIAAGLGPAVLRGWIVPAAYEALRWAAPLLLALYILAHPTELAAIRRVVVRSFAVALPLLGAYGLLQFVAPPAWDVFWMRNAPINSIGKPLPFQVRVFSMSNSPGSLATEIGTGLLLLLPSLRGPRWLGPLIALAALALTVQRATQAALLVTAGVLAATGSASVRRRVVGLVLLGGLALGTMLVTIPKAAEVLVARVETTGSLSQDRSARERWAQYEQIPQRLDESFLGLGLGWSSAFAFLVGNQRTLIDSGIIDILVSLGVPGGSLFLGAMSALVVAMAGTALASPDPDARAELAAFMLGLLQLPFGSQHTGEAGVCMWLSAALLLGRGGASRRSAPAAGRPVLAPAAAALQGGAT